MSAFTDQFEFQPEEENVGEECEQKELLGGWIVMNDLGAEMKYRDWTIDCKVKILRTEEWMTYSLSRGRKVHTIIVVKPSAENADLYETVAGVRGAREGRSSTGSINKKLPKRYSEPSIAYIVVLKNLVSLSTYSCYTK